MTARHYYNILAEGGRISWSNYANMMHEEEIFLMPSPITKNLSSEEDFH